MVTGVWVGRRNGEVRRKGGGSEGGKGLSRVGGHKGGERENAERFEVSLGEGRVAGMSCVIQIVCNSPTKAPFLNIQGFERSCEKE
jgi:hypothetical protein